MNVHVMQNWDLKTNNSNALSCLSYTHCLCASVVLTLNCVIMLQPACYPSYSESWCLNTHGNDTRFDHNAQCTVQTSGIRSRLFVDVAAGTLCRQAKLAARHGV